jgi:hypothetical protein
MVHSILIYFLISMTLTVCSIKNTILDIHRPVFCLKHDVSEAGFCLHLQLEPTQLGPPEDDPVS